MNKVRWTLTAALALAALLAACSNPAGGGIDGGGGFTGGDSNVVFSYGVVVRGSPIVEESLSVDTDFLPESVSYRWLRDGEAIIGATANTYTVTVADTGHTISVEASHSSLPGGVLRGAELGPVLAAGTSPTLGGTLPPGLYITDLMTGSETATGDLSGLFVWLADPGHTFLPGFSYTLLLAVSESSGPRVLTPETLAPNAGLTLRGIGTGAEITLCAILAPKIY